MALFLLMLSCRLKIKPRLSGFFFFSRETYFQVFIKSVYSSAKWDSSTWSAEIMVWSSLLCTATALYERVLVHTLTDASSSSRDSTSTRQIHSPLPRWIYTSPSAAHVTARLAVSDRLLKPTWRENTYKHTHRRPSFWTGPQLSGASETRGLSPAVMLHHQCWKIQHDLSWPRRTFRSRWISLLKLLTEATSTER